MIAWCLLMTLTAPTDSATEKPPSFTYQLKKAEDKIELSYENEAAVFHITNPSGIGSAAITFNSAAVSNAPRPSSAAGPGMPAKKRAPASPGVSPVSRVR